MRNSIQGPLLRTGHNSSFKALGETGYPVFKMAFQLREAIFRLDAGRDLARHLAIPQNDQGGDRTDWYSSFPGDVIPWSGASETERTSARQQFSEFQIAVQTLSEQLLNANQNGSGGDRRVFAQLLKSVVYFPDYDFVYLVNGVLVITFWGFSHQNGEQRNPIHWLQSSSVPMQTPSGIAAQLASQPEIPLATHANIPVKEAISRTRRWSWRWLLLMLLGLLLLALLLGLLRGCTPSISLPGRPPVSGEKLPSVSANHTGSNHDSELSLPTHSGVDSPKITGGNSVEISTTTLEKKGKNMADTTITNSPGLDANNVGVNNAAANKLETKTQDANNLDSATKQPLNKPEATDVPGSIVPGQADNQDIQSNQSQPHTIASDTTTPVIPPQGEPLTLPTNLPDGPAQFLNGQWRVNGGIQDKLTGRPLQLQYEFQKGTGKVSVHQSSGVTCNGPAKGNVQEGTLSISNPEQMKCSDGSNFIVPNIECKSPASGYADCIGSNDGEKNFPIRMLQPNS